MARIKQAARVYICPVCLIIPGLVPTICIKCKNRYHRDCVNWNGIEPFICVDCNSQDEFFVTAIIGHKCVDGQRKFLVHWRRGEPSWEPEGNLTNCLVLLRDYIQENSLEPTTLSEPSSSLVGANTDAPSGPTPNWTSMLKIRHMIRRWTARWDCSCLDLPITILGQDYFDVSNDQLALLKSENHCFVILLTRQEFSCSLRVADGNNLFCTNEKVKSTVTALIDHYFGWDDHDIIPVKCNWGARADLSGAAAILAALALSASYKLKYYEDTLYMPARIRQRVYLDLKVTLDSHHNEPFLPTNVRCPKCNRIFKSRRSTRSHLRFCPN